MADTTLTINLESENRIEAELKKTRRQIVDINEQVAKNNVEAVKANAETRKSIVEKNKALRAEKGLLSVQSQRLSLQRAGLLTETRRIRESVTQTNALTGAFKGLGTAVGAVGIGILVKEVTQFGAASLEAAGKYNNLIRGLEQTEGSAAAAAARFYELNELAKLPSLDRNTLIRYNGILQNSGATAEQVDTIYLGLSKSLSTFGGTAEDVRGTLLQLSQAYVKGKITAQDFRPILERSQGTFLKTAQEVHNFTGGIEEMRASFEASGLAFAEYFDPIFRKMANDFPGAEIDSYTNLIGNLGDAFGNLQAEIGNKLLPTFQNWAGGLLNLIEKTTDFIKGQQDAKGAIEGLSEALSNNATIQQKTNAIEGAKSALEAFIEANADAQLTIPNTGKKAGETAGQMTALGKEVESAKNAVVILDGLLRGSPDAFRKAAVEVEFLQSQTDHYASEVSRLSKELEGLSPNNKAQAGQYRQVKNDLDAAQESHKNYSTQLSAMQGAMATITESQRQAATSTEDLKVKVDNVETSTRTFIATTKALIPELANGVTGLENMESAFGKVQTKIDEIIAPLQNTKKELDALHAANNAFGEDLREDVSVAVGEVSSKMVDLEVDLKNLKSPMQDIIDKNKALGTESNTASEKIDHTEESMSEFADTSKNVAEPGLRVFEEALDDTKEASDALIPSLDAAESKLQSFALDTVSGLEGLTTVLGSVGVELDGINATLGSMLSMDPVAFLASVPGLVRDLNALIGVGKGATTTEEKTSPLFTALEKIETDEGLTQAQKAELSKPIEELLIQILVAAVRSGGEGLEPTLAAKFQSYALQRGFDFNYERDIGRLQGEGLRVPTWMEGIEGFSLDNVLTQATIGTSKFYGQNEASTPDAPVKQRPGPNWIWNATTKEWVFVGEGNTFEGSEQGAPTPEAETPAAAQPEDTTKPTGSEAGAPTPTRLRDRFSFTTADENRLAPFMNEVNAAINAFDYFTEETPLEDIIAGYKRLADAEDALRIEKLAIINEATGFTEDAKTQARNKLGTRFTANILSANDEFVDALETVGYELVYALSETSGTLVGSALEVRKIPEKAKKETKKETKKVEKSAEETLKSTHSFTASQNELFSEMGFAIEGLQRVFGDLTKDSSWQDITKAYLDLAKAEKLLHDERIKAIENDTSITEDARRRAKQSETRRFGRVGWRLNDRLTSALGRADYGLVNPFGAREGLRYDLPSLNLRAVHADPRTDRVVRATPDDVKYITGRSPSVRHPKESVTSTRIGRTSAEGEGWAVTTESISGTPETEAITEAEAEPPPALRDVFGFTGVQRKQLQILEGNVKLAQDAVDMLDDESKPYEVKRAYADLATAEQALYNQQVGYIQNATGITEDARQAALTIAKQEFDTEIRNANDDLVDAMKDLGYELVTAITTTTGILSGTGLAVRRIKTDTTTGTKLDSVGGVVKAQENNNAQRLRNMQTFYDDMVDLGDDFVKAEANRLAKIEALERTHQQKLSDIRTNAARKREDINRGFGEQHRTLNTSLEQNLRNFLQTSLGTGFDASGHGGSLGENEIVQRIMQGVAGGGSAQQILESAFGAFGQEGRFAFRQHGEIGSLDADRFARQQLAGIIGDYQTGRAGTFGERDRALAGVELSEGRAVEDAEIDKARREAEINLQATTIATALGEQLATLGLPEAGVQLETAGVDLQDAATVLLDAAEGLASSVVISDPLAAAAAGEGDAIAFHSLQSDSLAAMAGRSIARDMFTPSETQRRNARDFSRNVARGAMEEIRQTSNPNGSPSTIVIHNENVIPFRDGEVRKVTKRQIELTNQRTNFRIRNN